MVLKDWKKILQDTWIKQGTGTIRIRGKYTILVTDKIGHKLSKRYKTKSKAIAFAKAYMRKH